MRSGPDLVIWVWFCWVLDGLLGDGAGMGRVVLVPSSDMGVELGAGEFDLGRIEVGEGLMLAGEAWALRWGGGGCCCMPVVRSVSGCCRRRWG